MSAVPTIKPLDYFTRAEWSHLTAHIPLMGAFLIASCWAIIIAAAAMFIVWPNPLTYLLAIMVIGARQLGLAILMHDGAHGLLSKNRAFNDFLGHWASGIFIGASLQPYRDYHLKHHKFAQQDEDPDLVLSSPFPVTKDSMLRKIIRDLTGQTFFKLRVLPIFKRNLNATFNYGDLQFLGANLVLLLLATIAGYWWAYFALWLVPLATWNMLVTRLRNIAEHANLTNDTDPWRIARTTLANPIERLLIAPYWVHYHSEHHLFMYVPCYRLEGVHKALHDKGLTENMVVATGYRPVIARAASAV